MSRQAWLRTFVAGALGALIATAGGFTTGKRVKLGPVISVTPTSVNFENTSVGALSYQIVTISNTGDAEDYLTTANPGEGTFWPTYAGTCNTSIGPTGRNYYIPAGGSCTFQWGFAPSKKGKVFGTGTLDFDTSPSVTLSFSGKGTK